MKNFNYFKPKSLVEASHILLEEPEDTHIMNGGTDLIIRMREGFLKPTAVVDIKGIEELKTIDFNLKDGLYVGACVVLNEMAHHPIIEEKYTILSDAAKSIGSMQIRNRATMAGNICNASPLADTATPLLALDAKVVVHSFEGDREISIHDFFVGVRKTLLKPGEIVKGIKVPNYSGIKGGFYKISRRKEVDLSTVCGSIVEIDGTRKMAFGSVAPIPLRMRRTEDFLSTKELTDDVIKDASKMAASEVFPIDDIRGSKAYRLEMVEVLAKRGLKAIRV